MLAIGYEQSLKLAGLSNGSKTKSTVMCRAWTNAWVTEEAVLRQILPFRGCNANVMSDANYVCFESMHDRPKNKMKEWAIPYSTWSESALVEYFAVSS